MAIDDLERPWARWLRSEMADLVPYGTAPASDDVARLHANECPYAWPTEAKHRLASAIAEIELGRYPDPSGTSLRRVLGGRYGCDSGRIVLGNGSDEIISILLTAFSGGGTDRGAVVVPVPTFVMYAHSARVLGLPVREVEVDHEFQLRESAMDEALAGAAICFLARPNNPTGAVWDAGLIRRLIARHPATMFVVDEAYCAYAPGQSLWVADGPANYVHMATLSKVGLAGLRVGYCIATPELAYELNKVRHPYNVSATSLKLAETVLTELADEQHEMIARTIEGRERLSRILMALRGATIYPSGANLVLVRLPESRTAASLAAYLSARGVVIKDVSSTPGLDRCVRISVGTEEELDKLGAVLAAWSSSE